MFRKLGVILWATWQNLCISGYLKEGRMFCSTCGASVDEGSTFCQSCGAKTGAVGPVPPTSESLSAASVPPLPSSHVSPEARSLQMSAGTKAVDEVFCQSCGTPIKRKAAICPKCGVPNARNRSGRAPKDKGIAILLAVFLGFWTWLYTYQQDSAKFWIALSISVVNAFLLIVTFGLWIIVWWIPALIFWIWPIIDVATKDQSWYDSYSTSV